MEQRWLLSAVTFVGNPTTITRIGSATAGSQLDVTGKFTPIAGATGNAGTTNSTTATIFSDYELYEFDPGTNKVFPAPGTLNSLTSLNFQIYDTGEKAAGTQFAGSAGGFNVYVVPDSPSTTPDSSLVFNSDTTGLVGQANVSSSSLLGTIAFSPIPTAGGYLTFTASPGATALATLQSDLNANAPFRIAITPNTPTTAAGSTEGAFNGLTTPILTVNGDGTAAEKFSLSSPTYTVNQTSGIAEVSINRTGYFGDAATVSYAAATGGSLGTATASNFTPTTGTVSFAAGQQVATFSVAINTANALGGNKTFTVSLASPSAAGGGATSLGTTSAVETIVDTSAGFTNNLSAVAATVTDIEPSGAFGSSFAPVNGDQSRVVNPASATTNFPANEVIEFTSASSPGLYPAAGSSVGTLANLSLQLFNSAPTGRFAGVVGNVNVYYLADSEATTPTSNLTFQFADPSGVNGQASAVLLGTFSFQNQASGAAAPAPAGAYDTFTPATLNPTVAAAVQAQLNAGAPIRLDVAPQTQGVGAVFADYSGVFTTTGTPPVVETPRLSLTAPVTVNKTPETIVFASPTYSVNETAGTATITLTRSGSNIADSATVQYATSDGTALAGTNYTTAAGTATFAAGSATTTFTVSVNNVTNQGGNKTLNLTLTNPATTGTTTTGVLGTPSAATLTIVDKINTAQNTETLSSSASDVADIEAAGPYSSQFLKVEGTNASGDGHPSYGAADFNTGAPGPDGTELYTPAKPVTAINSISLNVYQGTLGTSDSGPINVYLVPDVNSNIDNPGGNGNTTTQARNPHFFDTAKSPIEGLDTTADFATDPESFGTPLLLGSVNYNAAAPANVQQQYALNNYSASTQQTLISALNNGTKFRIVATPESSSVLADIEGINSVVVNGTTIFEYPQIAFNVTEQPAPTGVAPTITSTQVGDGSVQRSSLKSVTVKFNAGVTLGAGSFTLYRQALNADGSINTGVAATDVTSGITVSQSTPGSVVFAVTPGGTLDRPADNSAGFLSDGIYQLVLHGANITDAATGTARFNGGSDQIATFSSNEAAGGTSNYFHTLFGDIDGNGIDNAVDSGRFSRTYLQSTGSASFQAADDYNADGIINAVDSGRFSRNYLKALKY